MADVLQVPDRIPLVSSLMVDNGDRIVAVEPGPDKPMNFVGVIINLGLPVAAALLVPSYPPSLNASPGDSVDQLPC